MICDCGHPPTPQEKGSCGMGYGKDASGKTHCYSCCAKLDIEEMEKTGKIVLYLAKDKVTNWPGSLSYPLTCRSIVGKHVVVEFQGPRGSNWSGKKLSTEDHDLIRCRRL